MSVDRREEEWKGSLSKLRCHGGLLAFIFQISVLARGTANLGACEEQKDVKIRVEDCIKRYARDVFANSSFLPSYSSRTNHT